MRCHTSWRSGIVLLLAAHAAWFAYLGLRTAGTSAGPAWQPLAFSVLMIVLARGVWLAQEWSRLACATIGFFFSAMLLVEGGSSLLVGEDRNARVLAVVFELPLALVWGAVGFSCLGGSARRAFAP